MKRLRRLLDAVDPMEVFGLASAAIVVGCVWLGALETAETSVLDRMFEWRGARPADAPIVIVTIDESSNAELNLQWPFPRTLHAELIDRVAAGGPLAVGIDLLFDTPSSLGPADDESLGAAVKRAGNVVLAAAPTVDRQAFYERVDLNTPVAAIRTGAAAVAPVNFFTDLDGRVRRVPLVLYAAGQHLPHFTAALHGLVAKAGVPVTPLPERPDMLINFRGGPRTFPWVPYYQVVRGEVEPEIFRDRIVLVGPTSEALHDVFATPFARVGDMPGVEIHANALATLMSGTAIREVPRWLTTAIAAAAAIAASAAVLRMPALRALAVTAGTWLAIVAGAYMAFAFADVWLRTVGTTVAVGLGYGSTVVAQFVREQREKRRLSRFFSPDVLRFVVRARDDRQLRSSRRLVTILFSDLRGFTSISEKLSPEQVADMLREYLTDMTQIVFRHGGTVDKYIGDCVMALYNVPFEDPEHAVKAVRTALDFQERTLEAATRWEERYGVTIRNGVGINTGEAVVGTLGSAQRLEYTAIGDAVNLAARLESITKDYHAPVIISESTYALVRDHFTTRALGEVTVKGKSVPVKIYAVLASDVRKYPRIVLDAGAVLTDPATGFACRARTRDISEGGLALAGVPDDWLVGRQLRIRVESAELSAPLFADATIVWRKGKDAGVQFMAIDETAPAIGHVVAARRP